MAPARRGRVIALAFVAALVVACRSGGGGAGSPGERALGGADSSSLPVIVTFDSVALGIRQGLSRDSVLHSMVVAVERLGRSVSFTVIAYSPELLAISLRPADGLSSDSLVGVLSRDPAVRAAELDSMSRIHPSRRRPR
mgnify:CR=1 FL=1